MFIQMCLLQILLKGPEGFFLMIEGGRIDHAHHDATAKRALMETVRMDETFEAVTAALQAAGQLQDTLIIVTADHAHTMSFAGYPDRGSRVSGR